MVRMVRMGMVLGLCVVGLGLAQDIDGKWTGKMQSPNGDMELVFNFKVNADTLTGTVESPMGSIPFSNTKMTSKEFSFDVSFNDMTISHQCTAMGDSILMKVLGMGGEDTKIILKRPVENK
jgi:hypothetical protein